MQSDLKKKYEKLQSILKKYEKLLIAFSGGVDSTFLLKTAYDVLGENSLGVIGVSPSLAQKEFQEAKSIAEKFGLPYIMIETHEMENENYISNPADRCYYCKKELFSEIFEYARSNGYLYIADGSNKDDDSDYRPGRQAAHEWHVVSPLKEAGLSKDEIRILSRDLGLPTWDKPALACLSSRFPTGNRITLPSIQQVERAEDYLYKLGFKVIRVRHHDKLARIELAQNEINRFLDDKVRNKVYDYFREIGYIYVTLDLSGYRQGSLNDLITETEKSSMNS